MRTNIVDYPVVALKKFELILTLAGLDIAYDDGLSRVKVKNFKVSEIFREIFELFLDTEDYIFPDLDR